MNFKFLFLSVFASMTLFCFAGIPPGEERSERAAFVSSLIKPGAIGAEIGVERGFFSYYVLLPKAPTKLYLIDPWEYGLQPEFEMDFTPENQLGRDLQYEEVCRLFAPFENVQVIRMKSEDAFSLFQDNYFDYVYIDGEHSYAAVTRDLTNYFPKVKKGGLIIGDDYGWTGIAPAVQDFLKAHPEECLFFDDPYQGRTGGQFVIRRLK